MLRKFLPIILLLMSILMLAIPAHAQELLFTNTPVASVDGEATPAPDVVSPMPPVLDEPTLPTQLLDKLFTVLLLLAVVALAFKQSNLIPPDVLDNVTTKLFGFAKEVTGATATTIDDQFIEVTEEVVRRWIREEQAKQSGTTPSVN